MRMKLAFGQCAVVPIDSWGVGSGYGVTWPSAMILKTLACRRNEIDDRLSRYLLQAV